MTKQITATIVFTLHEEVEDELQEFSTALYDNNRLVEHAIQNCLEDERIGVSQYESSKVSVTSIQEVEAVD